MLEKLTKSEFLLGVLNSLLIVGLVAAAPTLHLSDASVEWVATVLGVKTLGYAGLRSMVKREEARADIAPKPLDTAQVPPAP